MVKGLVLILWLGIALGCSTPNYHSEHYAGRFKQYGYGSTPQQSSIKGAHDKGLNSQIIKKYADRIAYELAQQVDINKIPAITVASFVDLDDNLSNTHPLGNKLAEDLLVAMQDMGYRVIDLNVKPQLTVTKQGQFIFARSEGDVNAPYVISGVINYSPNGANINARLVATNSGAIIAAYTLSMPAFVIEHAFATVEGQDIVLKGQ